MPARRSQCRQLALLRVGATGRIPARRGFPALLIVRLVVLAVIPGSLLAALYRAGFPHVAHGPMASDGSRHDATGLRAVNWLRSGDAASLEPSLLTDARPAVGFNLTILKLNGHTFCMHHMSGIGR